jgi:pseudaminic acid cytidylyltransferase
MNIAVIPARGGSKRIPRKNLKPFHGLPVIAYAIKAARDSEIFDQIIVSTDDEEIADVAQSFGAIIPWMRPKDLADDYATTISVMQHATKMLKLDSIDLENICCIYPATPFLKPTFLSQGLKILLDGGWSYVFSGQKASVHPQRFFTLKASEKVEMLFPGNEDKRTQDFIQFYYDAGQFYWGRESSWDSGTSIFSGNSTILEIPSDHAVDIDTEEDWLRAERLFERHQDS